MRFADQTFLKFVLTIVGLTFALVGLRGIIIRKPLVFSAKWFFGTMILCFLPSMINPFIFAHHNLPGNINMLLWLNPIMLLFVLWIFWIQMRGFFFFGITDESFRNALQQALSKLGIKYEERLSILHLLPPDEGNIQVSVQSTMGSGQIKARDKQAQARVPQIASEMRQYLLNSNEEVNRTIFIVYLVLGAFLLATVFALRSIMAPHGI